MTTPNAERDPERDRKREKRQQRMTVAGQVLVAVNLIVKLVEAIRAFL